MKKKSFIYFLISASIFLLCQCSGDVDLAPNERVSGTYTVTENVVTVPSDYSNNVMVDGEASLDIQEVSGDSTKVLIRGLGESVHYKLKPDEAWIPLSFGVVEGTVDSEGKMITITDANKSFYPDDGACYFKLDEDQEINISSPKIDYDLYVIGVNIAIDLEVSGSGNE